MTAPAFPTPPTRILNWNQEVIYSDPRWHQNYTNPAIYFFSNGRIFYEHGPGDDGTGLPNNDK